MNYTQGGIIYKIVDGILKGWRGESPFKKPLWNGTSIVEGFAQADAEAEAEEARAVSELLDNFEEYGVEFYNKIRTQIKIRFDKNQINRGQYKRIRKDLSPVLVFIKQGNWDLAQDALVEINRPNGELGAVFDLIENEINNYLNNS